MNDRQDKNERIREHERFQARARQALFLLLAVVLLLGFTACGGDSAPSEADAGGGAEAEAQTDAGAEAEKDSGYKVPEFKGSSFHEEDASSGAGASIDTSRVDDGYVAVSASSPSRLKFQVIKGEDTYNYDIDSGGEPSVFPLQCGDGTYQFKVMENITGSKYAELYSISADVSLKDEFQPFLRPSDYVDYSKDSACVKKAAEVSAKAETAMDVVSGVYDIITESIVYDKEKATSVQSGYLPDPDETLESGKGICFDYASLAAAMLRSQGIPTKVIFGYVAPDNLYHAWNMFYTEETGWVTVDYEVSGDSWNRLDLTFAAGGADTDFIGDGSHYSDVYYY